jgi:predicted Zn-dependent protease
MRALLSVILLLSTWAVNATTYIDVLGLYNPAVNGRYAGAPSTRINQLIQVSNQVFADSGLDIQLRLVHSQLVEYPTAAFDTALTELKRGAHPAFSSVSSLRQAHGADVVILFQPVAPGDDTCGIAYLNGGGTSGNVSTSRDYAYAVISPNGENCGDDTTVHEIGHLMGLAHSRRQSKNGDGEGTFPYATGHGEDGTFVTIMPYESVFGVYSNRVVYKFSSPSLTCFSRPCGVSRSNFGDGADSVYALTITAPQVAAYYAEPVKTVSSNPGAVQLKQLKSNKKAIEKQLKKAKKKLKEKNKAQTKYAKAASKASALYTSLQLITEQYNALKASNTDPKAIARAFKTYTKAKSKYDKALAASTKLGVKLNNYGDVQTVVNNLLASLADINNRIAMLKKPSIAVAA